MLNQVHIGKRMGKGFISDFGIAFFHTLHRLSHWQLSWRSNFQSVVIYRYLYRTMIQITTMYHSIYNQLTNGIRWNLINILAINSHNCSTQMNISQVLRHSHRNGFFYSIPDSCFHPFLKSIFLFSGFQIRICFIPVLSGKIIV